MHTGHAEAVSSIHPRRGAGRKAGVSAVLGFQAAVFGISLVAAPAPKRVTEVDREWWSFRPLSQVVPPPVSAAAVEHPVDRFLVARLEAAGLRMNPEADRRTRLRRASFGLTGLPPTPDETEAFEREDSPESWARVVDGLLASPRHGERWARHWLDVARFAESSGFEHDYDRPNAYHYRDFVVRALNEDMPYDQFVRWQIAGDEFAPENPMALMATGFLGAGVFPTQITANEVERTRYDALDDMLSTTGTAMLGLTIGCARCHDHKADPITSLDYYRMLAAFTTTVRSDIELELDPEETRRLQADHARAHAPLVEALASYEANELPSKFDAWLASGAAAVPAPAWETLAEAEVVSQQGATYSRQADGSFLAGGANPASDTLVFSAVVRTSGLRALRLEALADPGLPHGGPGRADNGNIGLSRIRVFAAPASGGASREVRLVRPRATFQQNDGHLSIAAALDENPGSGWAVDPQFGRSQAAAFEFAEAVGEASGTRLEVRLEFSVNTRHTIGRLRVAVSTTSEPALQDDALPSGVAAAQAKLKSGAAGLTSEERAALLAWWRTSEPGWKTRYDRVMDHEKQAPQPKMTKVLVCAEGYPPVRMHTQGADFFPETHVLARGSTDQKLGVAAPGFLQVLLRPSDTEARWQWQPPAGARYSGRRRALANWMTDVDHGAGALLARVIVNRLWQHHFGRGLVATPNDFGYQGAKPSHPELLEWLAGELVRGGWRLKPIHRLILTSAAYQQTSQPNEAAARVDPDNVLLARRLPRRLEAEAVRDSLLFLSGLLDPTMFGPGTLDQGSRRRSLYFTVKRSQMIPAMQAFDAPEPLVSQGQRQSTTVAPQALLLMNSPQAREWAAALAARLGPDATRAPASAVTRAYLITLNRQPTDEELADSLGFFEAQTGRHRESAVPDPEARALVDFAQVMLSLNECVYVD